MADDLVKRLREGPLWNDAQTAVNMLEAADRIEQLEAENIRLSERFGKYGLEPILINGVGHYVSAKVKDRIEKLEAALRDIADGAVADNADDAYDVLMKMARKALEGKDE
jgi:hypothetical protein